MQAKTSIQARRLPTRAVALGTAVIGSLLVGLAHSADSATKLRGARDISGMWADYAVPFTFNFDASRKPGEPQKVMLQPEYDARYKARLAEVAKAEAEGKSLVDALTLCLPIGMPGTMRAMFPMEIVATGKTIYVISQSTDPLRRIFLDGRSIPPLEDLNPTFLGLSVGRWEGNTLVVDTAGLKTRTNLEHVPHSDALRINERIRLLDDDTLEIVFTMTDPKAFKVPWVITRLYKDYAAMGRTDPGTHPEHKGAQLVPGELVCNENNRNLPDDNGVVRDGVVGSSPGGNK